MRMFETVKAKFKEVFVNVLDTFKKANFFKYFKEALTFKAIKDTSESQSVQSTERLAVARGGLNKIKNIYSNIAKVKKEFAANQDRQKQHLPKTNGLSNAITGLNEAVNAPVKPIASSSNSSPLKKAVSGFKKYQAILKKDGQELTPKEAFEQFSKKYPKTAEIIKEDLRQREMDKKFQAMQEEDRKSGLITAPIIVVKPKIESKTLSPEVKQLIDDGNKKYDKSLEAKSLKGSPQERELAAKELDMRRRLDKLQGREPSSSLSSKGGNTKETHR